MTCGGNQDNSIFPRASVRLSPGCLRRTRRFILLLLLAVLAVCHRSEAMFLAQPEKSAVSPAIPSEDGNAPQEQRPSPSEDTRPEDPKLQMQLQTISPLYMERRKVNSNTFSRLSGEPLNIKPVTVPASSIARVRSAPLAAGDHTHTAGSNKLFTVGSWAFVFACLGAAVLGLLRLKKLTLTG